jgi:zinc finger protein
MFSFDQIPPQDIPYFREVIVMASSCDTCGYRNSELKPGGGIPEKGKKITLHVTKVEDLNRDVIKSDTASVAVAELDLELSAGTLGGLVTTVEGLMTNISQSLQRVQGFSIGDSAEPWKRKKWQEFDEHLQKVNLLDLP